MAAIGYTVYPGPPSRRRNGGNAIGGGDGMAAGLAEIENGEPGRRRFPFDADGAAFRLAAEASRIRLAHLFDPYAAVHAARIEPLPHQLTAVYGEMLERQPLRFLLADDPGAGKTVMAGLLMKELHIRGGLERCLVVAPGALVEQWRDELAEKFDLAFDLLTRERMAAADGANPFAGAPRLIVRLDMLARDDRLQALFAAAPVWDLIVCDEAHRMSARVSGSEVAYTRRYRLGALAGRRARHFLLMTATPHNGKEEEFQLFMALLDPDRFAGRPRPGARPADPSDTMRRLTKEELRRFDGAPLFPERRARAVSYRLSEAENALYRAVTDYVAEGMDRVDRIDVDARRRNAVGFALQVLQRRLASSPAAIHESLKRRLARLEERLAQARLGRAAPEPAALGLAFDADDLEEAPAAEVEALEDTLAGNATAARTAAELEAEIAELRGLEAMAAALRRSGADAKWRELDRILDDPVLESPGSGGRRKLVVFTESRDTLNDLASRIRDRAGDPGAVAVLHGGVPPAARRAAIAAFNDDPEVRFLLATDAAGEGVNLHRGAHLMVNYDLPWNPNRLEQRFGRIHRIGQTETCHLWNLVAGETREGAVHERLLEKLETARRALGGRVYDVLGELFEGRPLRDLLVDAIRHGERPDARRRLFQAVDGAVDVAAIERLVARAKLAREGLDPAAVRAAREELERASARRLQPHHIRAFFEAAFRDAGGVLRPREAGRAEAVRVPGELRAAGRERGHAIPARYARLCFDKRHADGPPAAALLAPGHPLLDATVAHTLARHGEALRRGAVLVDDSDRWDSPRVLVCFRHALADGRTGPGGAPQRISERLHFVWLDEEGAAVEAGSAPYLDFRPARPEERARLARILAAPWLGEAPAKRARALAEGEQAARHLAEARARRLPELDRIETAVRERLRREIAWLQRRAVEVEAQERAGGTPRLNSENLRRQSDDLARRLAARLADLALQREIAALPPEILGAALVVPAALLRPEPEAPPPAGGFDEAPDAAARAEVEAAAMAAVMAEERRRGRVPRDVSAENRGYDIESRDPASGALSFVEVKGRRADARSVTVTRNEMLAAWNAGASYTLAVVSVEGGFVHRPLYLADPARLFGPEPGFAEVSRAISLDAIRERTRQNP